MKIVHRRNTNEQYKGNVVTKCYIFIGFCGAKDAVWRHIAPNKGNSCLFLILKNNLETMLIADIYNTLSALSPYPRTRRNKLIFMLARLLRISRILLIIIVAQTLIHTTKRINSED